MFNLKQFFMQKKNLFASAILMLCTLFVFTGCKEVMSSLDNPVSAYLKVDPASAKIYRGQSYKIQYSTISDAKPIFKSADEKIALVDANGVVTGANKGTTTISIELPATDYYQAASAEFTVEVDALLSLPEIEAEIGLTAATPYHIVVNTESNGLITYESSNPKVATVDKNGNVTPVACGDAIIYISIAATPEFDRTETAVFNAKVRVLSETELNNIITAAAAGDGKVKVMLKDGFELENDLNLEGKKIELDLMNSILTFKGNQSFIISDNFTLKNAKIDASNSSVQIVKMTNNSTVLGEVKKNGAVYTLAGKKDFYYLESINIENVWVKNLKNDLITNQNIIWAVDNLTIKNSIIQANYTGGSSSVIWLGNSNSNQGSIHNLDVDSNIFYNIYEDKTKGTQRFISIGNSSNAIKAWGTTAAGGDGTPATAGSMMDWKFNNNICINVGYNKFGNNVPSTNKNMKMEGKDNIFYDVRQIFNFFTAQNVKTTTGNKIWCPNVGVNTTDITRTDSNGNKLAVEEDPGITVPTEPLDLVNGVVVK